MGVRNRNKIIGKDKIVYYQNVKGGDVHQLIITLTHDAIFETSIIEDAIQQIIPNAKRAWWN